MFCFELILYDLWKRESVVTEHRAIVGEDDRLVYVFRKHVLHSLIRHWDSTVTGKIRLG